MIIGELWEKQAENKLYDFWEMSVSVMKVKVQQRTKVCKLYNPSNGLNNIIIDK